MFSFYLEKQPSESVLSNLCETQDSNFIYFMQVSYTVFLLFIFGCKRYITYAFWYYFNSIVLKSFEFKTSLFQISVV